MAKITRKTLIQFGNSGPSSSYGQFGSKEAGFPQTSQDPTVLQALSAWILGWQNAVVSGNKAAYLEDMNGWCYVHSYMAAYMFQAGIPEWDPGTTYFIGSVVQDNVSGSQWFSSLQDNNLNNTPPAGASNAFWRWVNPPQDLVGTATLNTVPKVTSVSPANGVPGSKVLGDSAISDDGVDVIIALPLKFPDNTVQTTAASSVVTNQANVGPSGSNMRSLAITYQNTTPRPIFVCASILYGGGPGFGAFVSCDANPAPTTVISQTQVGTTGGGALAPFFIVLPGYYYVITATGSPTLAHWIEWS